MSTVDELAAAAQINWFDYQLQAFKQFEQQHNRRLCLFFRTGAGKTLTSLGCLMLAGYQHVLVIAPPRIHDQWRAAADTLSMDIEVVSHEKFRQADWKVPRLPMIVDEFHQLGGVKGQGWQKLQRVTDRRDLPLIVMSATPYWNDAERVFCAKRVVEGFGTYEKFLYDECLLEPNPYSRVPNVTGFRHYPDELSWMAARSWVCFLPDTREVEVIDVGYEGYESELLYKFGLDERRERVLASMMEERHARRRDNVLTLDGWLRDEVVNTLITLVGNATSAVLLYCNSAVIAESVYRTLRHRYNADVELMTGTTSGKLGEKILTHFRDGELDILVGTATMRTGTDGLDKACDTLIIVDDTDDDAARMQLIGRILPRGVDAPIDNKFVYRLVPT